MGLRVAGVLTQAAQVLYVTRFMPDYPQCLLKMGRFRGTTVTCEIVDNRQEHMSAFAMVGEGMAFLERTMPLGARFPEGKGLPSGVKIAQLSGPHLSKPTNPLIAEAFHRTGAVEVWGRGTNRVIEMCQQHGAPPPVFEEKQGFVVVTFRAPLVVGGARGSSGAESGDQVETKSGPSQDQVKLLRLCREAQPLVALMEVVGRQNRTKFRDGRIKPLIEARCSN